MEKIRRYLCAVVLGILLLNLTACNKNETVSSAFEESDSTGENVHEQVQDEKKNTIYVQIDGAVKKPGVSEVESGSRLFKVIEMAGGFSQKADTTMVNQASILTDEQQIYVYSKQETEEKKQEETQDGKINLNSASKKELMTLPGIGETKADSIIRYREERGNFSSIEELMDINGIKDGVFQKVKDYIKV